MEIALILNVAAFAVVIALLARRQMSGGTLSSNVLLGLIAGVLLGAALQMGYGRENEVVVSTLTWVNLVGSGYVRLLQMIVIPLVLVSILSAVTKLDDARSLGKISAGVLSVLLFTTAFSALIGVGMARLFNLNAAGLVQGARELERGAAIESNAADVAGLNLPDLLLSFLPTNIFADLSGARDTSIIAVVIFASLLGIAVLGLRRDNKEVGDEIVSGIDALQKLVMRLVRIVIRLTPYGVLALMTRVVARSNGADILSLGTFVVASYVGLLVILAMHAAIVAGAGVSPRQYFRDIWPVLTFAFTSRSSAATIPLTVEAQVNKLRVSPAIANFSASFGATIGQNGCAGLYPAMLAMMIAPSVGVDPTSFTFILSLVVVATLGSFGIAGVGGGATFAAIVVLSTLNLPVALAGLLISVEPLIDMGRTAVNVSGAMTSGVVTNRVLAGAGATAPEAAGAVPAVRPIPAGVGV